MVKGLSGLVKDKVNKLRIQANRERIKWIFNLDQWRWISEGIMLNSEGIKSQMLQVSDRKAAVRRW